MHQCNHISRTSGLVKTHIIATKRPLQLCWCPIFSGGYHLKDWVLWCLMEVMNRSLNISLVIWNDLWVVWLMTIYVAFRVFVVLFKAIHRTHINTISQEGKQSQDAKISSTAVFRVKWYWNYLFLVPIVQSSAFVWDHTMMLSYTQYVLLCSFDFRCQMMSK